MTVGEAPVIQHLQEDVEDFRMGFLHLVQQDHRVRPAPHRLGEIAPLLVTHVSRRRTDEPRHGVLLHEFRHVDARHGVFGVEQKLCQCLGQLRLAHPGGSQEEERAVGPVGIGEPGAGAADGVGNRTKRLLLADHAGLQKALHPDELLPLPLEHLGHRDAGPLGDHLGNLFVGHAVTNERRFFLLRGERLLEFAGQFRDTPVLQLRHPRQVAGAMGLLKFGPCMLKLLLQVRGALHDRLFRAPDFVQVGELTLQIRNGRLKALQPALGRLVRFLLQRLALDLQLDEPALQPIKLLGLGIDLHADARTRFVHKIDGLVGKLAIGDVPM